MFVTFFEVSCHVPTEQLVIYYNYPYFCLCTGQLCLDVSMLWAENVTLHNEAPYAFELDVKYMMDSVIRKGTNDIYGNEKKLPTFCLELPVFGDMVAVEFRSPD